MDFYLKLYAKESGYKKQKKTGKKQEKKKKIDELFVHSICSG